MTYRLLDVSAWQTLEEEPLGSKAKVWLLDDDGVEWLFKEPRLGSGEHWAERVVAEVARLLGIPHARVEIARRGATLGSIAQSFTPERKAGALMLGNYLLSGVPGYESGKKKPRLHSVEMVLRFLQLPSVRAPSLCLSLPWVRSAADTFVGYLMLDALVGNTDRHHENWGVLIKAQTAGPIVVELAPTFDHASSLGRELHDEQRERRLSGIDTLATVELYCDRGRSPLYSVNVQQPRALRVRQAFVRASEILPAAASGWIDRLAALDTAQLTRAVAGLPAEVASPSARRFAEAMLHCNRHFLLSRKGTS